MKKTLRASSQMRFNKTDISCLAVQPSHKFEKEGVLFIKEKQDGFFRKTEIAVERWCRLRGNLLFYFKSRDHWSEPAGVIIIVGCQVKVTPTPMDSTFGFLLVFDEGQQQHLASYTESERDSWVTALRAASHISMRQYMESLQTRLKSKLLGLGLTSEADAIDLNGSSVDDHLRNVSAVIDFSETPLFELSCSCDNLLCDALGRSPSAKLTIKFRNSHSSAIYWRKLGQTEVVEKSSNPTFLRTFLVTDNLGIEDETEIRVTAYDLRDRFTATRTLLGSANIQIKELNEQGRLRLKLESPNPDGRTAGFVTLVCRNFEPKVPASTDSTPVHKPNASSRHREMAKVSQGPSRRSQSLSLSHGTSNTNFYQHSRMAALFANPIVKTFRFHSGLGGDIAVQEIMAESKLAFTFPQQLLSLWICEEKELVHEMAALGELKSPWHGCQMAWLENHLDIINKYSQALENLDSYEGNPLRKSTQKGDRKFEFVPTNLHLQRLCVENDSLRKSSTFDLITHGAFTSFGTKSQGLIKMLKDLKAPQKDSTAWCSESDRLQMAEDTLSAVRRVRKEVVDCMRLLMKLAKEKKRDGMFEIVEDMLRKTKCLCSLLDLTIIEEVFAFIEENRVDVRPEKDEFSESVAEFMQRNKLKIDLPLIRPNKMDSLQTPCAEFISKELRTPEIDIFSPQVGDGSSDFWRTYSAYTSGYQSVDKLSDIDEFEENFRCLSVIDKTRHYYTLCQKSSPFDTPVSTPPATPKKSVDIASEIEAESTNKQNGDEGIWNETSVSNVASGSPDDYHSGNNSEDQLDDSESEDESKEGRSNNRKKTDSENSKDQAPVSESANGLYYRSGDEPEPIDLTHLNIEAAMMCLASKVRFLSGKADSPTISSRTFRFRELDAARKNRNGLHQLEEDSNVKSSEFTREVQLGPQTKEADAIQDWASELRPSMRKLRQGMDSLCKTARLACSIIRLQQQHEAVDLSHAVRYRRDVCFSQALTTLITSLMNKFWCSEPDQNFLTACINIGPLVAFEGLLSLHGEDVPIFNDMIVAVEDLRNVEFTLFLVDKRPKLRKKSGSNTDDKESVVNLENVAYRLPRVTGSRSNLKVLLPIPGSIYSMLPLDKIRTCNRFNVNPVFFNIGINENATIAAKFGQNGPQEKNNIDNFKILAEYQRRFKRLQLAPPQQNGIRASRVSPSDSGVDDLLSILKNEVFNRKNKNVEILNLSSQICRKLHGLRFCCCKSGKDRTGMSASHEQAQILLTEFDLAEHEYQRALDVMRSEGTRRDNTEKNVGKRMYAFNSLQLTTFPVQYRPPVGTYGNVET